MNDYKNKSLVNKYICLGTVMDHFTISLFENINAI